MGRDRNGARNRFIHRANAAGDPPTNILAGSAAPSPANKSAAKKARVSVSGALKTAKKKVASAAKGRTSEPRRTHD